MSKEDLRKKALEQSKEKLRKPVARDQLVTKAVKLLDESKKNFDEEFERFRDWYSLYFPEIESEIGEDQHLVKILSDGLRRDELDAFKSMAEKTTGKAFEEEDLEVLEQAFNVLKEKHEASEELETYIREAVREEMPNLYTLLNPLLVARLLALAGGLEELAKKPASTVQMLGAEKALFRYLSGEGTPPKHGVLFEHEYVSDLPEEERGKMARFLANKTVMAARIDVYGDKDKGEEYREKARKKYEELSE